LAREFADVDRLAHQGLNILSDAARQFVPAEVQNEDHL